MHDRIQLGRCALISLTGLVLVSCGLEQRANYRHDVEIAPDQWLTLKEERGKCWFICEWNGKKVTWPGKRNRLGESELPVTLRSHEGNLYLIVRNREDLQKSKHFYLKLDPSGTRFVKISPGEFPKQIATENMTALYPRRVGVGNPTKWIDSWEVIRKLDFENPYFVHSETANLWIQLETGLDAATVERMNFEQREPIIREYAKKYQPIRLPTVRRELQ
jgi:hypothetical protein